MSKHKTMRLFRCDSRGGTIYVALPFDDDQPDPTLSALVADAERLLLQAHGREQHIQLFEDVGDVLVAPSSETAE